MKPLSRRTGYVLAILFVIALGLLSRIFPIGFILWDKYLGDALYAVMIYLGLLVLTPDGPRLEYAVAAFVVTCGIESFQLTGIPANLAQQAELLPRLLARALGTHFAWWDIVAYLVGIVIAFQIDERSFSVRH